MCANCWRQSLKVFCQLRPSYCRITHTCPTLHCQKTLPHLLHIAIHCYTLPHLSHIATQTKAPPKNNTYESVLFLQPFIVATISQWVFKDSHKQTIDRKCHFLSSSSSSSGIEGFLLGNIPPRRFCFWKYIPPDLRSLCAICAPSGIVGLPAREIDKAGQRQNIWISPLNHLPSYPKLGTFIFSPDNKSCPPRCFSWVVLKLRENKC